MTNFYVGVFTFTMLSPGTELTVGQVTILLCVVIVGHSLPVEIRISQKAGARMPALPKLE